MRTKMLAASILCVVCASATAAHAAGKILPPEEVAKTAKWIGELGTASGKAIGNLWKETKPLNEHPYVFEPMTRTPAPRLHDGGPSHAFDADKQDFFPPLRELPTRHNVLIPDQNSEQSNSADRPGKLRGTAGALGSGAVAIGGSTCLAIERCSGKH
jgi:hypothetical protein